MADLEEVEAKRRQGPVVGGISQVENIERPAVRSFLPHCQRTINHVHAIAMIDVMQHQYTARQSSGIVTPAGSLSCINNGMYPQSRFAKHTLTLCTVMLLAGGFCVACFSGRSSVTQLPARRVPIPQLLHNFHKKVTAVKYAGYRTAGAGAHLRPWHGSNRA